MDTPKERRDRLVSHIVIIALAIVFILPLLWVVVASFDSNASEALKAPTQWTLQNYKDVLSDSANKQALVSSVAIAMGQTIIVVVLSGLAAYPLSRYELRYNNIFMYTILFMTALPMTAVMVPVYRIFTTLGVYDNRLTLALFMAATSLPYGIWMMKNFMDSVPVELEEAAWVDGANTIHTIVRIVSPLMLPGIAVVAIFTFSGSWGNFFTPYILLSTADKFPLSIRLYQFFGQYGMVAYGDLAAYSILYSLPAVLLYIISQKYMSQGFVMTGGTKG